MQLPSGTATVSVEAGAEGESRSLGFSEKTLPRLRMREPGYLLRRFVCQVLQVRGSWQLLTQKNGCGSFGTAAASDFLVLYMWFPPYHSLQIARQKIPAC